MISFIPADAPSKEERASLDAAIGRCNEVTKREGMIFLPPIRVQIPFKSPVARSKLKEPDS